MKAPMTLGKFKEAIEARWPNMRDRDEVTRRAYRMYQWFCLVGLREHKFDSEFQLGYYKMRQQLSEMMVAHALSRAGYALRRTKNGGPDFIAERGGYRIQVEVVTPEPTANAKAYVERKRTTGAFSVPFSDFIECWTKGVSSKCAQAIGHHDDPSTGWISKGLLDPSVPFVIVVNGILFQGDFPDEAFVQMGSPMIVRALYAMSEYTMFIDLSSGKRDSSGYTHRQTMERSNKGPIPLDTFLDPRYAPVSAVWAIAADEYDLRYMSPALELRPDNRSALVHNPNAQSPLPLLSLPVHEEFTCDIGLSERTIHRTPSLHFLP